MIDPETGEEWVFVLTGWAAMADHMNREPQVFASHEGARRWVATKGHPGFGERGWWKEAPARWIKWTNPRRHSAGFWEILAMKVKP